MNKVLLIGDSIRIGYGQRVRELLSDTAEVIMPDMNCKWTKFIYWHISLWAGDTKFDAIHWNSGIWDTHRIDGNECFCSLDEYIRDNERLLKMMKRYSDKLIWATSTPGGKVLDEKNAINALENTDRDFPKRFLTTDQYNWNKTINEYNTAAVKLYESQGVYIDDLNQLMLQNLEDYLSPDGVHPNEKGYEALAQQVAKSIRDVLRKD